MSESSAVVPTASEAALAASAVGQLGDALGDLQQARRVLERLQQQDHDVSAQLQASLVCGGASPLEALEAVTATVRQAPHLEVHSIAWARSPGPVEGSWQYQATLLVSVPDRHGETTGVTHHVAAGRP